MDYKPEEGSGNYPNSVITPNPKQKIAFHISFTPNEDYEFIKWQALDGNEYFDIDGGIGGPVRKSGPRTLADIIFLAWQEAKEKRRARVVQQVQVRNDRR
jgi:hypothetical protein